MADLFSDRLLEAIEKKGSPICVGIDPVFEMLPDDVAGDESDRDANDIDACIDAVFAFTTRVLKTVAPYVPVVKFQSAFFEKYLWEGVEAYYSLIQEAAELDLLVIGDVKRGDIGSTASAYAAAHLADPPFDDLDDIVFPDAITVNPMLGADTLAPFVDAARDYGKGLFVLVRTSNPGSATLQDVRLEDGRTWSEMLADTLRAVAATEGLVGSSGYSSIGAVVGATQPHTMRSLRQRLPQSIFLLPGYGTQGATADMTREAFQDGRGAIVSASRSILYAHRDPRYAHQFGNDWERCVEQATKDMAADIANVLGSPAGA
ncbi:MAG TPA: orotidine-5'-phosphate decarboxylase [Tepidisphaeraceae bacterium]|nr:orotidine-5'-phosphate decarboxylase [Tepidisphaeraceae bacterium]